MAQHRDEKERARWGVCDLDPLPAYGVLPDVPRTGRDSALTRRAEAFRRRARPWSAVRTGCNSCSLAAMIYVETLGKGGDVVLLHGTPTSPSHLRPLAARLSGRWRTHLVHLPGCGESPSLDPYDLDESNTRVSNALFQRGVREACFVGMSGGAYRAVAISAIGQVGVRALTPRPDRFFSRKSATDFVISLAQCALVPSSKGPCWS